MSTWNATVSTPQQSFLDQSRAGMSWNGFDEQGCFLSTEKGEVTFKKVNLNITDPKMFNTLLNLDFEVPSPGNICAIQILRFAPVFGSGPLLTHIPRSRCVVGDSRRDFLRKACSRSRCVRCSSINCMLASTGSALD